jgi:hypothetical protein
MKSRRMRGAGHVAHMGDTRNVYIFWSENLKGRDHLRGQGIDWMIILE